jgi:hypothetical protein
MVLLIGNLLLANAPGTALSQRTGHTGELPVLDAR